MMDRTNDLAARCFAVDGRMACLLILPALFACALTGTDVQHRSVARVHTLESLSISSIEVDYSEALSSAEQALVETYHPGEQIAHTVRAWAEETGMWGGPSSLSLRVHSIRLPDRWEKTTHGPIVVGSAVAYRGEDYLGVAVEIRRDAEVVHGMDLVRTLATFDRSFEEIVSSDRAMSNLVADVAWHVVYEMTPPGYDEDIILLGHREQVQSATVVAARRGLLSYGEVLKAVASGEFRGADLDDVWCGSSLAKPDWLPWWIWDPFTYRLCEKRAREDALRR